MDARLLVPFCPVCQVSFIEYSMQIYRLSCNHLVCGYCIYKLRTAEDRVQCCFDNCFTLLYSATEILGLKDFFEKAFAAAAIVVRDPEKLQEILRLKFNLIFDMSSIPCQMQDCASRTCRYDHSRRHLKQRYCMYGDYCESWSCILKHPREEYMPPPQQAMPRDQQSNEFYGQVTQQRRSNSLQFVPPSAPTVVLPHAWTCPNCNYYASPNTTACPRCSYMRPAG